MKRLIIAVAAAAAALMTGTPASAGASPDFDCYTTDTYNGGTRTTCRSGYPDYITITTECDGYGHCTVRSES